MSRSSSVRSTNSSCLSTVITLGAPCGLTVPRCEFARLLFPHGYGRATGGRRGARWWVVRRAERLRWKGDEAEDRAGPGQRHGRGPGRERRADRGVDPPGRGARRPGRGVPRDDADRIPGGGSRAARVVRRGVHRRPARGGGPAGGRGTGRHRGGDRLPGPAGRPGRAHRAAGRRAAGRGGAAARRARSSSPRPSITCRTTGCSTSSGTSCPATRCRCSGSRPATARAWTSRSRSARTCGRTAARWRCAGRPGAALLVVPNASPYERGKDDVRLELCVRRAREAGAALAYANMIGGQDELVFDGDSILVGRGRHAAGPRAAVRGGAGRRGPGPAGRARPRTCPATSRWTRRTAR